MSSAIRGIEEVLNRFARLQAKIDNLEHPLKASGVYMTGSIERNFKAQGRPAKWRGLADSTLAARRTGKGSGGAQILIDTAALKSSVTSDFETSSSTMSIGTNMVQAKRMHFGYPEGEGRGHSETPARPFLLFQDEDADAILKIFNKHFEDAL